MFATPVLLAVAWFETNGDPVGAARRSGRTALVSAVFMAVSGIAFVVAVTLTAISNVVVIVATTPIAAALASLVLLGERTDRATWIAIAGTAAGVLVVGGGSLGRHHGYGYVGPRVYFRDDSTLTATGGIQAPVFAPGEPKVSSRAPSREVQFEITYTRPLWRRR